MNKIIPVRVKIIIKTPIAILEIVLGLNEKTIAQIYNIIENIIKTKDKE